VQVETDEKRLEEKTAKLKEDKAKLKDDKDELKAELSEPPPVFSVLALFNPEASISTQKRHPHAGNLNSDTLGDSKNVFLRCGDV